jgi:hypothetical protein
VAVEKIVRQSHPAAVTGGDPPVIAPGGPRPRDSVIGVGPGQTVVQTAQGTLRVVPTATLKESEGSVNMPDDLVLTPGGLRPPSQVHLIESGAVVDGTGGRLRELGPSGEVLADFGVLQKRTTGVPLHPGNVAPAPPGVAPAFGSGWITYAWWTNATGTPLSYFSTTWVVPDPPASQSGQVIFLFPGIQNSTMIYQPVLQWGQSAAGGGNYWAVASWYVDGQGGLAYHSALVPVNPGDTLVGVMTLTGQSGSGFSYNCEFQGIPKASLAISNVEQLTWLAETLEVYGITKASDYPEAALTEMENISISTGSTHPAVTWTVTNAVTDTGQHTVVESNSSTAGVIDLNYYGDQANWAWCHKCQGLAFAGNILPGPCPGGYSHDHTGSGNYVLVFNATSPPAGQSDWQWCNKCQGLAFAGDPSPGACPAGGVHNHSGSGDYVLVDSVPPGSGQSNWQWCNKCQGLAFAGSASPGPCPAGGVHDHTGSGNYELAFESAPQLQQSNWRWCDKCQGLVWGGNSVPGPCPAGGTHNLAASGDYALAHDISPAGGQANWRWCTKCQGLAFAGDPSPGSCPAGGVHNHTGSANYVIAFSTVPITGVQPNWRWCNKCQGMAFGGSASPGPCPAGGVHNHTGSGNYELAMV